MVNEEMLREFILIAVAASICSAAPQFIITRPLPVQAVPHPVVLQNAAMEESLPDELKNDVYKNPLIAAALSQPSWFGPKEGQVTNRETDTIPRHKIFHLLHNAGLARR